MVVLDELLGDDITAMKMFPRADIKQPYWDLQVKFPKHWHVMETLSPDVVRTSVFSKQVLILELMVLSGRTTWRRRMKENILKTCSGVL